MTFIEFLKSNSGKSMYVDHCAGNNGDILISLGMKEVIAEAQSRIVHVATDADIIIINGGGMFIDAYAQGVNKLRTYTELYPDKPLCVAPSSYYFKFVNFEELLSLRSTSLFLFSRDDYSKRYVDHIAQHHKHVYSHIDNDLALQLQGSETLNNIATQYPSPIKGKILVVDRMDLENPRTGIPPKALKRIYQDHCPKIIKTGLRSIRLARRNHFGSTLTAKALKVIEEQANASPTNHVDTIDISRTDISSFEQFIERVATAEHIFTNRLHVGILGSLLGRSVYLEEGSYHKILGVYEYSLAERSNVRLLTVEHAE